MVLLLEKVGEPDDVSSEDKPRIDEIDGFVSTQHAMKRLGVTLPRIHQLINEELLDVVYWDGRTPMIRKESLDAYIAERAHQPRRGPARGQGGRPRKNAEGDGGTGEEEN